MIEEFTLVSAIVNDHHSSEYSHVALERPHSVLEKAVSAILIADSLFIKHKLAETSS